MQVGCDQWAWADGGGQTEKNQMDLMGLKDVMESKATMTEEEFEVS